MNERIREMAYKTCFESGFNGPEHFVFYHTDLQKFAELLIRECAEITDGLSKLYPRTDVAFDVGYTMGTSRATKEIKQHFGVEE